MTTYASLERCEELDDLIHDWMRPYTWAEPWTSTVKDDVKHHLTTCPLCLSNRVIVSRYLDERRRMRPEREQGIVRE
jgi:hypothetical protein